MQPQEDHTRVLHPIRLGGDATIRCHTLQTILSMLRDTSIGLIIHVAVGTGL